ncbi:MAG TPA: DUF4386 domain-containing protein [Thermoanaerobaculia bacterium]
MNERNADRPADPKARAIGVVYLLYPVAAIAGALLMKGVVVAGNPAATAKNILAHEAAYRAGVEAGLVGNLLYLALAALFYFLFAPVSRRVSLVAAFVAAAGCALQIFGALFQLAPLLILRDAQLAASFNVQQLQAASLFALRLQAQTLTLSIILFAFYHILIGWLIVRCTFLPRAIGVLMIVAGIGWLAFLWPPLGMAVRMIVLPLGGIAELVLMLWLLIKGVNLERWRALA